MCVSEQLPATADKTTGPLGRAFCYHCLDYLLAAPQLALCEGKDAPMALRLVKVSTRPGSVASAPRERTKEDAGRRGCGRLGHHASLWYHCVMP